MTWPWHLTPLTAQTLGGWCALPGVTALMMGLDGRWTAIRITLESQLIGLALILVGTTRAWDDVDTSNALAATRSPAVILRSRAGERAATRADPVRSVLRCAAGDPPRLLAGTRWRTAGQAIEADRAEVRLAQRARRHVEAEDERVVGDLA